MSVAEKREKIISAIKGARPNQNCFSQFRQTLWNQTTDVHRGSTLITRVIR